MSSDREILDRIANGPKCGTCGQEHWRIGAVESNPSCAPMVAMKHAILDVIEHDGFDAAVDLIRLREQWAKAMARHEASK
jgi:hypothetical protein